MNNNGAHMPQIGLILGNVVGWWAICWTILRGIASVTAFKPTMGSPVLSIIDELFATVVSSVVAAVVVIIAVRHLPATRPFLRKFVALLLLMTLLSNGFYVFATTSHDRKLTSSLSTSLSRENQQDSTTRGSPLIKILGFPYLSIDSRGWAGIDRSGALLTLIYPFAAMTILPCFLLMLITPSFLALPVFWLCVVLSALYVVLPRKVWKWMRGRRSVRGALSSLLILCLLFAFCAASPGEKTTEALGFSGSNIGQGELMTTFWRGDTLAIAVTRSTGATAIDSRIVEVDPAAGALAQTP